jgi:hypothetical protein
VRDPGAMLAAVSSAILVGRLAGFHVLAGLAAVRERLAVMVDQVVALAMRRGLEPADVVGGAVLVLGAQGVAGLGVQRLLVGADVLHNRAHVLIAVL